MKKKKYITLIAALTLSSAFVLNGCSLALPGEETKNKHRRRTFR